MIEEGDWRPDCGLDGGPVHASELVGIVAHPDHTNTRNVISAKGTDEDGNKVDYQIELTAGYSTVSSRAGALIYDSVDKDMIGVKRDIELTSVDLDNSIIMKEGDSRYVPMFSTRKYRFHSRQTISR